MVIIARTGVSYAKDSGHFYCPCCEHNKTYERRRTRNFITIYLIPTIPLRLVGDYVECRSCFRTYDPAVLTLHPGEHRSEFEAEFQRAIRRVMIKMMLADGVMHEAEVEAVCSVYRRVANAEISPESVKAEAEILEDQDESITETVEALAPQLNDQGKKMVIQAAYNIAASDGEFQAEEEELLGRIADALGMTADYYRGVLGALTAH